MGGEGELAAAGLGQHRLGRRVVLGVEVLVRAFEVGRAEAAMRARPDEGLWMGTEVAGHVHRNDLSGVPQKGACHAALTLSRRRSRLRSWAVVAPHTPSVQTGRLMT